MRAMISCFLAAMLFSASALEARVPVAVAASSPETATERKLTVQERLMEVPPGTMIEVKLRNKQKVRGRLGGLDTEEFNLTAVEGNKVVQEKIAYPEVKSFKKVQGNKAGHALVYTLAGIGVLTVVLLIVAATMTG